MLKITLIAALATVLVVATAFGIYRGVIAQTGIAQAEAPTTAQVAAGQGTGFMQGQGQAAGSATAGGPMQGRGRNQNQAAGQSTAGGRGQAGQAGGHGQLQQAGVQGTGVASPQNGITEWLELSGTVSNFAAPNFTLTTADGQVIPVQLGSLNYVQQLGLELAEGQEVTLVGGYETSGSLAVRSISVGGEEFLVRDATGRPLWAGHGRK